MSINRTNAAATARLYLGRKQSTDGPTTMSHAAVMSYADNGPEPAPRLPSMRPLDQRWDRSRGIVFGNVKRPSSVDYTWTPNHSIVISSRPYAARALGQTSQQSDTSKASMMNSPHVVSSFNQAGGGSDQLLRMEAARNQERDEKEKLQAKYEKVREEMRTQEGNLRHARDEIERLVRRKGQEREAALNAYNRAKEENKKEHQKIRDQEKERWRQESRNSDARLADATRELYDTQQQVRKLEDEKNQMDDRHTLEKKDLRSAYDQELEQMRTSIEQRQAQREEERSSYAAYREAFEQIKLTHHRHAEALLHARRPLCAGTAFIDELWVNYMERVAKLDMKFKDKHPKLAEQITTWIAEQGQPLREAAELISDQVALQQKRILPNLKTRAHHSRELTRIHHVTREQSGFAVVDLGNYHANGRPLMEWGEQVSRKIQVLEQKIKTSGSESEVASMMAEMEGLKIVKNHIYNSTLVSKKLRDRAALEALLGDALAEKEVSFAMHSIERGLRDLRSRSHALRDAPGGLSEAQNREMRKFEKGHRELLLKRDDHEKFVRKRANLEASLGLITKDREEELNRFIRDEMQDENSFIEELGELSVSPRMRRRDRIASAKPLLRAQSAPVINSRKVSARVTSPPLVRRSSSMPIRSAAATGTPSDFSEVRKKLRDAKVRLFNLPPSHTREEAEHVRGEIHALRAKFDSLHLANLRRNRATLAKQLGENHERTRNLKVEIERHEKLSTVAPKRRRIRLRGRRQQEPADASVQESDAKGSFGAGLKPSPAMSGPHRRSDQWRSFHSDEVRSLPELGTAAAPCSSLFEDHATEILMLSKSQRTQGQVRRPSAAFVDSSDPSHNFNASSPGSDCDISDFSADGITGNEHGDPHVTDPNASMWTSASSSPQLCTQEALPERLRTEATSFMQDDMSSIGSHPPSAESSFSEADNNEMPDTQPTLDPPVTYNISSEDRRTAAHASKHSNAAYWSFRLYKNAEAKSPTMHYCTNAKSAQGVLSELAGEKVLGFDLEWEPRAKGTAGIKKNVSLIQIASESKIVLLHIALWAETTAEELILAPLREILESEEVIKVGVNISGDARRMREYLGVDMKGTFELSHLYRVVKAAEGQPNMKNRKLASLADQVQAVLLLPLKKDQVRVSAWSRLLNMQQCDYAASDAYAGFRLFHELEAKRKTLEPRPPRPEYYESFAPLIFADGTQALVAQIRSTKAAAGLADKDNQAVDDGDEFYDAAETLEASEPAAVLEVAGVPLAGLEVSYPALPMDDEHSSY